MRPTDSTNTSVTPPPMLESVARLSETSKPLLRSKTFWVQILAIAAALIPAVGQFVKDNPVTFVTLLGALNTIMRFATSDRVHLFSDDLLSDDGNGGTTNSGSGGSASLWLLIGTMAVLMTGLPSCSNFTLPTLPEGTSVTGFYQGRNGNGVAVTYTGKTKPPATVELIPAAPTKASETLPLVSIMPVLPIPAPVTPLIPRLGEPPLPPPVAVPPQIGLPPGPFVTPTK